MIARLQTPTIQHAIELHRVGRLHGAELVYLRLLQAEPDDPELLHRLGDVLSDAARPADAVPLYQRAVALAPQSAETWANLGNALAAVGRPAEAIDALQKSIAIFPDFPQALTSLGVLLNKLNRPAEALPLHVRAAQLLPNHPDVLDNLGSALTESRRPAEAIAVHRRAEQLAPGRARTADGIGNALVAAGDFEAAVISYQNALAIRPDYPNGLNNLGTALEELGRRDEAMECYQRALSIGGDTTAAEWNAALLHLLRGDFAAGWPGYERRPVHRRAFDVPRWDGSPLNGRRILVHAEQGFGDAIHFCRYVPLLKGPAVIECHSSLARLMRTLPNVVDVISPGDGFRADVHVPMMSLPGIFGTTLESIPSTVPYLSADLSQWAERFKSEPPAFRVGVAWAGHAAHLKDRRRSIPPTLLRPLVMPGVRLYSLQLGNPAGDLPVVDWTADLADFTETTGLISNLDLVVTVDTAVAHLAGALGRPVWVLIPFAPDWRWMLDRTDSPWYPTMRLYRQTTRGDWPAVVARVAADLSTRAARQPSSADCS